MARMIPNNVSLTIEQKERLEALSRKLARSQNDIIREGVEMVLRKYEKTEKAPRSHSQPAEARA